MTDKEKLKEIKKLADAMYYAAFNLTTNASLLRKAMEKYHQFIIHEYCKEEPVSIWHDMSEEAENGRNTIIIDPKDFYGAVLRKGGSQLKNHNKERYVKWAYIDELIEL